MCSTRQVVSKSYVECSYGSEYTPVYDRENCLTLLYGPKSEKIDAIMKTLAELNGLTFGEDIVGVSMYLEHCAYLKIIRRSMSLESIRLMILMFRLLLEVCILLRRWAHWNTTFGPISRTRVTTLELLSPMCNLENSISFRKSN